MRKLILAGLLILALFAAWQAAAPWMALDTLRDAAREGDHDALEQNIDFPALRASAKAELSARLDAEVGRSGDNPLAAALYGGLLNGLVDRGVDAMVTPNGMSVLLVSGGLAGSDLETEPRKEIDWGIRWDNFGTFRAVPETSDGKTHPSLIFKRDGLGWKLAGVDIPDA